MAKCIGNCVECELDVDKVTCCNFQVLKQSLLIRKALNQLSQRLDKLEELHPAIGRMSEITDAEPDALGAAEDLTVEGTTQ
jgi:hypothetical protein